VANSAQLLLGRVDLALTVPDLANQVPNLARVSCFVYRALICDKPRPFPKQHLASEFAAGYEPRQRIDSLIAQLDIRM